jgi:hypothetical protein
MPGNYDPDFREKNTYFGQEYFEFHGGDFLLLQPDRIDGYKLLICPVI